MPLASLFSLHWGSSDGAVAGSVITASGSVVHAHGTGVADGSAVTTGTVTGEAGAKGRARAASVIAASGSVVRASGTGIANGSAVIEADGQIVRAAGQTDAGDSNAESVITASGSIVHALGTGLAVGSAVITADGQVVRADGQTSVGDSNAESVITASGSIVHASGTGLANSSAVITATITGEASAKGRARAESLIAAEGAVVHASAKGGARAENVITAAGAVVHALGAGRAVGSAVITGNAQVVRADGETGQRADALAESLITAFGAIYAAPNALGRGAAVIRVNETPQEDVVAAILNAPIESGMTLRQAIRLLAAVNLGKTTITNLGGGNAIITFRDVNDTKTRVTASMAGSTRVSVTYDST